MLLILLQYIPTLCINLISPQRTRHKLSREILVLIFSPKESEARQHSPCILMSIRGRMAAKQQIEVRSVGHFSQWSSSIPWLSCSQQPKSVPGWLGIKMLKLCALPAEFNILNLNLSIFTNYHVSYQEPLDQSVTSLNFSKQLTMPCQNTVIQISTFWFHQNLSLSIVVVIFSQP